MFHFLPHFLLLVAIGLTAAGGAIHGRLSHRWGPEKDISLLGNRLISFPHSTGPWTMRESFAMDQSAIEILQCSGYVNRQYVNDETGEIVSVAVLLGPAGPISVHTPEVCYSSREYTQIGDRTTSNFRDGVDREISVWTTTFESTRVEKSMLRVYYAWSSDGHWAAVNSPRFKYAGQPHLLKIQLAVQLPAGKNVEQDDPGPRFLRDFIPALNQHLFHDSRTSVER